MQQSTAELILGSVVHTSQMFRMLTLEILWAMGQQWPNSATKAQISLSFGLHVFLPSWAPFMELF